jgi:NAD+ synthase (glutamine-hydrolysing)
VRAGTDFYNLYNHDFVRVAVGVPGVRVADPAYNAEQTLALMREAVERKAIVVLFPELGLSAYTCDDLFHQRALLDGCRDALANILAASASWPIVAALGMPLEVDHLLYNCAVIVNRGRVLGVVPKTYPPNYREFYELRQFNRATMRSAPKLKSRGNRKFRSAAGFSFQPTTFPR